MFTALAPVLLHSIRDSCIKTLPANAYLVAQGDQLIARYAARAEPAKPAAIAAFGKIAGTETEGVVTPELFDSMAGPMIASALTAEIKPDKCPTINKVAELLDPMPAANLSALVVLVLQLATKGEDTKLPICKLDG